MTVSNNFQLYLQSYSGDYNFTDYFFDQIKTTSNIYKWSPDLTVKFIREKFSGPAWTYFTVNKNIYNSNDNILSLTILPQETVKHFSRRLNKLASVVHKNVTGTKTLDKFKLKKLRSALP